MTAIEKMLASMLGITPEKMQETIAQAINLLQHLDDRLNNIETMIKTLHDDKMADKAPGNDPILIEDKLHVEIN